MINKPSRTKERQKRHHKMRRHLKGTAARPRLAVFRSNKHIYAQVIDDTMGHTLVCASTADKALVKDAKIEKTSDITAAKAVGADVAKKALAKGISTVVFDRGGNIYHGKIAALADSAREAGLAF
jgi:large subunit ribosomal protein L18